MRNKGFYWIKVNSTTDWEVGYWNGVDWNNMFNPTNYANPMLVGTIQIKKFESKTKKSYEIHKAIELLEINDSLIVEELICSLWGSYDEYVRRSFDVMYLAARKLMPEKQFKVVRGEIQRVS